MSGFTDKDLEQQRIKAACDFIADVAERLRNRTDIIINRYFKDGDHDGTNWRCGSVHGQKGQSFAYNINPRSAYVGTAYDFATGESFDSLRIIMVREKDCSTKYKAAQFAARLLNLPVEPLPINGKEFHARKGCDDVTPEVKIKRAQATYHRAQDFYGTLGEKYLRDVRGIVLDASYGFKFSQTTMVRVKGENEPRLLPALLVPSCDEHGNMDAVGKFFLTDKGELNRAVLGRHAKKIAGVNRGRAVPLNGAVKNIWFVTEGFEDCATAKMYLPKLTGRGILGASVLDELVVPKSGVDTLIVFQDNDPKKPDEKGGGKEGQAARQRLYARLNTEVKQGLRSPLTLITIKTPKPFKDINEMHRECEPHVVAAFLHRQLDRLIDPSLITVPVKPDRKI